MTREELAKKIFDAAYITGSFLLRSGVTSHEYFDKYQFESRPELLAAIAEKWAENLPSGYDALGALEMGGIPLATALSLKTGMPVIFVRKKAKQYGTAKIAEGMDVEGKKILIIEDVVTSGGQIVLSVDDLRARGAIIDKALCVIDRQSGGPEILKENGIELVPLFTMTELKEAK